MAIGPKTKADSGNDSSLTQCVLQEVAPIKRKDNGVQFEKDALSLISIIATILKLSALFKTTRAFPTVELTN